jgi:hypothetical protein
MADLAPVQSATTEYVIVGDDPRSLSPTQSATTSIMIALVGTAIAAGVGWAVHRSDQKLQPNKKAGGYSAWAIVNSSNQMLVKDHRGNEKWKSIPQRGIASGAFTYRSEQEANYQISWMNESGHWPLMKMKPRLFTWK